MNQKKSHIIKKIRKLNFKLHTWRKKSFYLFNLRNSLFFAKFKFEKEKNIYTVSAIGEFTTNRRT